MSIKCARFLHSDAEPIETGSCLCGLLLYEGCDHQPGKTQNHPVISVYTLRLVEDEHT